MPFKGREIAESIMVMIMSSYHQFKSNRRSQGLAKRKKPRMERGFLY